MTNYTDNMEAKAFNIDYNDEKEYRTLLSEAASSFRSFDEALDALLIKCGYKADIEDAEKKKICYIGKRFFENGIPLPRDIDKWYSEHRMIERDTAFKLCFALGLDINETNDFFKRIFLGRSFDLHSVSEAAYYFCMKNGFDYSTAHHIVNSIPKISPAAIDKENPVFTGSLSARINVIHTVDEFISYVTETAADFGYNNVTAHKFIEKLWNDISSENGIAHSERNHFSGGRKKSCSKKMSVWEIYLLMLFGEDNKLVKEEFKSRTIKPILKNNQFMHRLAEDSFPDRDGIEKAKNGEHISYERMRKLIILLVFYRYFAGLSVKTGEFPYKADYSDSGRCRADIDRYLTDSGYPELYYGNPYDWIFLSCLQDDFPLYAFREYMNTLHEEYFDKSI